MWKAIWTRLSIWGSPIMSPTTPPIRELSAYGLDNPELTITAEYTCENETGEAASGTFVLHISRDPQEREAAKTAEKPEDDLSEITAYARVGDSQIVYQISGEEYETPNGCLL